MNQTYVCYDVVISHNREYHGIDKYPSREIWSKIHLTGFCYVTDMYIILIATMKYYTPSKSDAFLSSTSIKQDPS